MCSPGCGLTDWCNWSGNNCDGVGTCQPRPMDCAPPESVVCGCDGSLYRNQCEANGFGRVDTQPMTGCPTPSGMFRCGIVLCMHGAQYCETRAGGSLSTFPTHTCRDLPAGCGATPTCACIQGTAQCGTCTVSAGGDLMMDCLAP